MWLDERADLYALGTTLVFLFTGAPLFSEGRAGLREQVLEDRAERALKDVPAALALVLRALLARDRADRLVSAAEVAETLRASQEGRAAIPVQRSRPPQVIAAIDALVAEARAMIPGVADRVARDLEDELRGGLGDALVEGRPGATAWRERIAKLAAHHVCLDCLDGDPGARLTPGRDDLARRG